MVTLGLEMQVNVDEADGLKNLATRVIGQFERARIELWCRRRVVTVEG